MDWEKIEADLKKKGHIKTASELARVLGVTQQAASKWECIGAEPNVETKLRALDLLGYIVAREAILILFPKAKAKEIIAWNNSITTEWNERNRGDKKKK